MPKSARDRQQAQRPTLDYNLKKQEVAQRHSRDATAANKTVGRPLGRVDKRPEKRRAPRLAHTFCCARTGAGGSSIGMKAAQQAQKQARTRNAIYETGGAQTKGMEIAVRDGIENGSSVIKIDSKPVRKEESLSRTTL